MDKPVLFLLTVLAVILFFTGGAAILLAKGNSLRVIGGMVLIGAAVFIAYGLDTYCPTSIIYSKCGE